MQAEGRQPKEGNAMFGLIGLFAPTQADRGFFPRRLLVPLVLALSYPFVAGFFDGLFDVTPKDPLPNEALIARHIAFVILTVFFTIITIFYALQWWKLLDEMERLIEGTVAVCFCGLTWIGWIIFSWGFDYYSIYVHEDIPLFIALPVYLLLRAIVRWRLKAL